MSSKMMIAKKWCDNFI